MAIETGKLEVALALVRPLILGHGGDVRIASVDPSGVVEVEFLGACKACPNLPMTYVGPVRSALMAVPGVSAVRCERVHASGRTLERMARLLGAVPVPV
jgi:Fe-S cluster biogenesis protein NfuA